MRILITGASGYLGQVLLHYRNLLPEHELILCSRQSCMKDLPSGVSWQELSGDPLTDCNRILACRPTHLFHFSAISSPARCEQDPELSCAVNIDYTRMLADVARTSQAHLLFTSTDWVFDGNTYCNPLTENDVPHPECVYAKHKHAVEQFLLNDYGDVSTLILRVSLVFGGPCHAGGTAQWLLDRFKHYSDVPLFHDEYRTPIYSRDLVRILSVYSQKPFGGLYHCGGGQRVSRYEMGLRCAEVFGFDPKKIISISRMSAGGSPARPQDLSLDSSALYEVTGVPVSRFDECLENLTQEVAS